MTIHMTRPPAGLSLGCRHLRFITASAPLPLGLSATAAITVGNEYIDCDFTTSMWIQRFEAILKSSTISLSSNNGTSVDVDGLSRNERAVGRSQENVTAMEGYSESACGC